MKMRANRRKSIEVQLCRDHHYFFIMHPTDPPKEKIDECMRKAGFEVGRLLGFRIISSAPCLE
jgi:hypothetical protein